MKEREILEQIVAGEGSCAFANNDICTVCPMSRLKLGESGNYLSCIEALNAQEVSGPVADALYKESAVRLLLDLSIEDMLTE